MLYVPRTLLVVVLHRSSHALVKYPRSGYTNEELFVPRFQHSFNYAIPNTQKSIVRVADNHYSHITPELHTVCKRNDSHLLHITSLMTSFPNPRCHFSRPLEKECHRKCYIFMKVRLRELFTLMALLHCLTTHILAWLTL